MTSMVFALSCWAHDEPTPPMHTAPPDPPKTLPVVSTPTGARTVWSALRITWNALKEPVSLT